MRFTISALSLALLALEAVCRFGFRLADPPLSQADPAMEYLFQPLQTCHPLRHLVHINSYSMRADEFPRHKSSPQEFRVMVIGDSVVYDGVQIDQQDICTEVLKRRLQQDLKRPVVVGNIAAKSWGPPNELAYVQRFGLFDADVVVVVLNSHDYADVPTHLPIVDVFPDYPSRKPIFALGALLQKTVWKPDYSRIEPFHRSEADIHWALSTERQLYRIARKSGAAVWFAFMRERGETDGHLMPGHAFNLRIAQEEQVPVIPIGDRFQTSLQQGANPYLDRIHPNVLGCRLMAKAIQSAITHKSPLQ